MRTLLTRLTVFITYNFRDASSRQDDVWMDEGEVIGHEDDFPVEEDINCGRHHNVPSNIPSPIGPDKIDAILRYERNNLNLKQQD